MQTRKSLSKFFWFSHNYPAQRFHFHIQRPSRRRSPLLLSGSTNGGLAPLPHERLRKAAMWICLLEWIAALRWTFASASKLKLNEWYSYTYLSNSSASDLLEVWRIYYTNRIFIRTAQNGHASVISNVSLWSRSVVRGHIVHYRVQRIRVDSSLGKSDAFFGRVESSIIRIWIYAKFSI